MKDENSKKLKNFFRNQKQYGKRKQAKQAIGDQVIKETKAKLNAFMPVLSSNLLQLVKEITAKFPEHIYSMDVASQAGKDRTSETRKKYPVFVNVTAPNNIDIAQLAFEGNPPTGEIRIVKGKKSASPIELGVFTPETLTDEILENLVTDFYLWLFRKKNSIS